MKKGFTLAEILVTLVMIGMVASLTIPSLVNNINDQQNKVAWRKAFSDISQATMRIAADNGGSLKGLFTSNAVYRDQYLLYLNYVESCNSSVTKGNCWHFDNSIKGLNGLPINWGALEGAVLSNGVFLNFYIFSTNCSNTTYTDIPICGYINVDINGFRGPNTMGKDIFRLWVMENQVKPFGHSGDVHLTAHPCNANSQGDACSALYLYQ